MRPAARPTKLPAPDQHDAILCFDGGAAIGPYQAGIYDAIEHMGFDLGWILATDVGAVNAAIIASNPPDRRLQHLYEFWARLGQLCRATGSASPSALAGSRLQALLRDMLSDLVDP